MSTADYTLSCILHALERWNGTKEDVKRAAVKPVLGLLGWNVMDSKEVDEDYELERRLKPDYALLCDREPRVVVAVGNCGHIDDACDMINRYGRGYVGAATDGKSWRILLDGKWGDTIKVGKNILDALSHISREQAEQYVAAPPQTDAKRFASAGSAPDRRGRASPYSFGADPEREKQVRKLVRNYERNRDKLLQVTKRNRSVQFKRVYKKHNFDLTDLEPLQSGTVGKMVSKAVKNIAAILSGGKDGGESLNILRDSTKGDDADAARAKLRTLSRNLAQIEEETGQQVGYLGFPFLQGNLERDFYVRGPVVLFPVSLEHRKQARNGGWFLHLRGRRPILNGALIAALKTRGGYGMEGHEETFDGMIEGVGETGEEDSAGHFFDRVNEWLGSIIAMDAARNRSEPLKIGPLGAGDLAELQDRPLHLVNHMLVGNFPQADSAIHRDYETLIKNADRLDVALVGDLLGVEEPGARNPGAEAFGSERVNLDGTTDANLNLVLPSDPSQDEVILESRKRDLVVSGPPGTGKSQVIVNLIANALTNKKRVLVVCQKRAALEVVKQRLEREDLARHAVFLEKEIDDRAKMYGQLAELVEPGPRPYPPADLDRISGKIDECVKYLAELGGALKKRHFGGVTIQELYVRADRGYEPFLDLDSAGFAPDWRDLDSQIRTISGMEADFKEFEDESHPWFGRRSFAGLGMAEIRGIRNDLKRLVALEPDCTLMDSPEVQLRLHSLFEECLKNRGWFGWLKNRKPLKEIRGILKSDKIKEDFVAENAERVRNGREFWNVFSRILDAFGDKRRGELLSMAADVRSLADRLRDMEAALEHLDRMQQMDKNKSECGDIFGILRLAKGRIDADQNWSEAIRQEVYHNWIDKILTRSPILIGMPEYDYAMRRKDLAELMEKKREAVKTVIRRGMGGGVNANALYGGGNGMDRTKLAGFKRELNRKRKVKPVRKLFEEYGQYMFRVAPCWLASPESVSKVFPLKRGMFDLVIVDEASQLAVERSLPFLYRAKRAVIAGDDKQLPPFDLFQAREAQSDGDEDGDEIMTEKSLLDLASASCRSIMLSWHYRSEYRELIDFSNHAFYGGRLNVAPRPDADRRHPPIRWIRSNGTWEDNANTVEAKTVVDEIKNVWECGADRDGGYPSIGVITFNERQQDRIKDIIEERLGSDPEFLEVHAAAHKGVKRDDSLFVKNIENVQGDERDVIIFSVGYARDADGVFANRFGTINQTGGEKRLNVAITRARREMVVVSSINPDYIALTSKNPGPRLLRRFLEYAKSTDSSDAGGQREALSAVNPDMQRDGRQGGGTLDSEFERQVRDELEKRGHRVETQIGDSGYRIDLAIVHPQDDGRYVLGIECDGATFHSSQSVKERDVLRQRFLEGRGWTIERIWSRKWWVDPNGEIDRIDDKVKRILERDARSA